MNPVERKLHWSEFGVDIGGQELVGDAAYNVADKYTRFREQHPYLNAGIDIGLGILPLVLKSKNKLGNTAAPFSVAKKLLAGKIASDISSDVVSRDKVSGLDVLSAAVPLGSALRNSFFAADTKAFMQAARTGQAATPTPNIFKRSVANLANTNKPIGRNMRMVADNATLIKDGFNQYRTLMQGTGIGTALNTVNTVAKVPGQVIRTVAWRPGKMEVLSDAEKATAANIFKSVSDNFIGEFESSLQKYLKNEAPKLYNNYLAQGGLQNFDTWLGSNMKSLREAIFTETAAKAELLGIKGPIPATLVAYEQALQRNAINLDRVYNDFAQNVHSPLLHSWKTRIRTKPARVLSSLNTTRAIPHTFEQIIKRVLRNKRGGGVFNREIIDNANIGAQLKNERKMLRKLRDQAISSKYTTGAHHLGKRLYEAGNLALLVKNVPPAYNMAYDQSKPEEIQ